MSRVDNNEEALQRARDELEVKVRERTADLRRNNEQLQKEVVERRQAEEALRESEARFRAMFENSGSGMALIDMQGRPIECNPTFLKTLGYTEEEISRMSFIEFTHPDDRELNREFYGELMAGKRDKYEIDKRYITKDGRTIWANVITTLIRDEDGLPQYALGMMLDITERKLAEERLKRSNEELRALSTRLHSVREEESARIAREIHDELGASLSSLKWGLEEIGEDIPESADTSPPEALREKVAGMITLTDNAVDAVRRIASELRPIALEEFGLAEALRWHAQQFQARTGIAVYCDCVVEGAELNQERATALFRIVQEALTNVLRHAQATKVEIRMNREAGYFILTVSDNGKGITKVEKSASQSLGLLGMRERAHLLGGEINIESTDGRGTAVTVRVPITG